MSEKIKKENIEANKEWTTEDEETLNNLLMLIEKTKARIEEIDKKLETLETQEEQSIPEIIEQEITQVEEKIEIVNEKIIEEKINESLDEEKDPVIKTKTKNKIFKIPKFLRSKLMKYIVIPLGLATSVASVYHTPQEYYEMFKNYKERHIDKNETDDPNIVGIDEFYADKVDTEKSTMDFLGEQKIDYKFGYYRSSVFDLSDRTPPKFKIINGRENYSKIDSAAGITTNFFKPFQKFGEFTPVLKGHQEKNTDEAKGDIPVIGYNKNSQTIKAGHYKEFNDDWLVSETYEIPLNFKLNADSTINLAYHDQAMRMVPLTTNEQGKQIPFPIGITYDKKIKNIKPEDCTRFGTLEGGKVLMSCGEKQVQVNGNFSDMYRVYQRLQKENPATPIQAYLLDNGSYNLPIWDNDNIITKEEINSHLLRNRDGGTALVLINDGKISPFEYKNKYKEQEHYTINFTKDSVTGKPVINEKSVIVLHHTGYYPNSSTIIKQFESDTTMGNAHVLILKDGTRHIFNNDDYVLAHAGKSKFNGRDKVNFFSIGIEMEGDSRDKNAFTIAQIESMLEYIRPRVEKYNIKFDNITDHKRIRDNWLKANPSGVDEKGNKVFEKEDMDDKVWLQLQKLIKEKVYTKTENKDLGMNEQKLLGMLAFQDEYRRTADSKLSLLKSSKILKDCGVSQKYIKQVLKNIESKLV